MNSISITSETELQKNNKLMRDGIDSIAELLKLPPLNLDSGKDIKIRIETIKDKIIGLTEEDVTSKPQPMLSTAKSSDSESINDLSVSDINIDLLKLNDPPMTPTKKQNFSKTYSPMKTELKATKPKPKKLFYSSIKIDEDKPNYAYEEKVRAKNKRSHMPGGECACCKDFNEAVDKGTAEINPLKDRLNQVSRHRKLQPRPATPENYWDLDMD
ncbi:hypothetical protein CONCODRAFT_78349 [Conidiobolus coronatus NRRL 28638]|uniref:DNA endonuclease activator Ctp1 C-terminal domain-containing protein n=1 Tax=Conidiobolus coronatus (strain ATCC 28846 / CBS 209.66 / NRRL 28638) TaxID=796925 RepID=A0A137P8W3_CONC2|nr:hypothetical protein CONCODRAFT_78349 [Conidiobolus coronatus NRRL 28638]|eukprot:KXN71448.1 hypothetical protein CONCODRAFT_78349 [Conidiobolus coronatus NRRL 28638]